MTPPGPVPRGRLARLGLAVSRHARAVLLVSAALLIVGGVFGADAGTKLVAGGYTPDDAESGVAQRMLSDRFRNGTPNLVLVATASGPVDAPGPAAQGRALQDRIERTVGVAWVRSFWSTDDPVLRSRDGRSSLVLVQLAGSEDAAERAAVELVPRWRDETPGFTLRATGKTLVNADVVARSDAGLVRAELIGAPLAALILLMVFGSPLAALLPVAVGVVAITVTFALLDGLASFTSVSQFALNVSTALGFGLAVDYSLFLVTRYREELDRGRPREDAVVTAVATAGRTVLFSALTVAISLAALLVFPLYLLRSLAYAAIPVVLVAGLASITVLPALLLVAGRWVFRFDVTRRLRRAPGSPGEGLWHRWAHTVMRRPLLAGLPVVLLLVLLLLPFFGARFGLSDYRVLPPDAPTRSAAALVDEQFPEPSKPAVQVFLKDASPREVEDYAGRLSDMFWVDVVATPGGAHLDGIAIPGAPVQQDRVSGDVSWLTVVLDTDSYGSRAEQIVSDIRAEPPPGSARWVGGDTAVLVDTKATIADRLGLAALVVGLASFVLLFLFTGSLLMPVKAIVLNLFSLTASFGAMVYIFQDGHLREFVGDFTVTGYLEVTVPILMFCVAFGLSMDYEVFLLSRIREVYDATGDTTGAVALGLERTGKLFTAAALVVACTLGALATSELSLLKLLGVGLAVAVVIDAVLIRSVLVPAFMRVAGRANWWAPRPLVRLHERFGLREEPEARAAHPERSPSIVP